MSNFLDTKADRDARLPIPPKVWFPLSTRNTISKKLLGVGIDAESRDLYSLIEGAIDEGYLVIPGAGYDFLSLADTPNSYAGNTNKFIKVNGTATALEFGDAGDMLVSTYDPTSVAGDAFNMDNMVEGAANLILSNSERAEIATIAPHIADTANPHNVTKAQVGLSNVPNVDTTNASNITTGTLPTSVLPPLAIGEVYEVASEVAQLALTAQSGDIAVRTDESKTYIRNSGSAGDMTDWTELLFPGSGVTSVNGQTGVVSLTTTHIPEGTNLYFTDGRVDANATVIANAAHAALTSGNPHMVTATEVGLGNVDNTSDLDKPISTATQAALDTKLESVVGGANISIDNTDPLNPIINATGLVTDHGGLTGLSDDDHPQYHNDSRANTWLAGKTTDNLTEGATNLYFTQARVSGNANVVANTAKNSYPTADALKLAGIETNATADQSDAEIETAYNNQVSVVDQPTAEAGISTTVYRWTPERVKQAIDANITLGDLKVARYRSAAAQNADSTSNIAIEWDNTSLEDTDVFSHDDVTNNSQIQILEDGKYLLSGAVNYHGTTGNYRFTARVSIQVNGSTILSEYFDNAYIRATSGAYDNSVPFSIIVELTANDYVEILSKKINTTSGNAVTTDGTNLSIVQLKGIKGEKGDDGSGTSDPDAIHDNVAGEINAITQKSSPVGVDIILIEDSADSYNKKKSPLNTLPVSSAVQTALNTKLEAGDNVSDLTNDAGYLTSFTETDPVYTASSWFSTTNNSSNWDTAFGWGDHGVVGYLESVIGGTGITIDVTDPVNPIINSTADLSVTLQDAYDNSTAPQITTDSTNNTLILKGDTGDDNDGVFGILNSSDSPIFSVQGTGIVTVVGNIVVTGNVDGRDVSTDGTNLDNHIANTSIHIPSGGIAGQVIEKIDGTDYNVQWSTPSSGVTDHGLLSGLGDDDHTQYHTDGRADTWLGTKDTDDLTEGSTNLYNQIPAGGTTNQILEKIDGTDYNMQWTDPASFSEVNDLTAAVTWDDVPDANITESSVTQHEGAINHDNLLGFVANEHIDWTADAGASNIHVNNITAVPESAVTAHEAALTITESQISDLSHFTPTNLLTDYGFTDNSSNWDTAYGWGDHSTEGYLTSIPGTYLESGDNISELVNDSGYITSIPGTYLESGDNVSELVNDAGYITSNDGNGLFTSSNSGGTIASAFTAVITDKLTFNPAVSNGVTIHGSAARIGIRTSSPTEALHVNGAAIITARSATPTRVLGVAHASGILADVTLGSGLTLSSGTLSHAAHTGEVTGTTALTVGPTAISNRTVLGSVDPDNDYCLILDATDGLLKKTLANRFQDGNGILDSGNDTGTIPSGMNLNVTDSFIIEGLVVNSDSTVEATDDFTVGGQINLAGSLEDSTSSTGSTDDILHVNSGGDVEWKPFAINDGETVSSGNIDVDFGDAWGGHHPVDLATSGTTPTIDFTGGRRGGVYAVQFYNYTTTVSPTWASNIKSATGAALTLIKSNYTFFFHYNGTDYINM